MHQIGIALPSVPVLTTIAVTIEETTWMANAARDFSVPGLQVDIRNIEIATCDTVKNFTGLEPRYPYTVRL